jgi:hypothetical protein
VEETVWPMGETMSGDSSTLKTFPTSSCVPRIAYPRTGKRVLPRRQSFILQGRRKQPRSWSCVLPRTNSNKVFF